MGDFMSGKKGKNPARRFLKAFLLTVILSVCVMFVVSNFIDIPIKTERTDSSSSTTKDKYNNVDPNVVVAQASLSSVGDILIHTPVFNSVKSADNVYDFNPIFKYIVPYMEKYDYNIANLEVSLGGTENGRTYSGYPLFNCPDSIIDAAKYMGSDMLLLSNNHTYDCGYQGFIRKIGIIENSGLEYSGVAKDNTQKLYSIVNVNGIKIGIINYTYETVSTVPGTKAINGIPIDSQVANLINSFDYNNLDVFYADIEEKMSQMKADGAEVIVVYPHWGDEYDLDGNVYQDAMAQKMCDLGVDVIIGGHPHVVEPVRTFTSEISGKRTVCLYSLGNFISNQRRHLMGLKTGNTEDGMIFVTNFEKYGDGTVIVKSVEVIPTWVDLTNGKYTVIPLDKTVENWATAFNLSELSYELAKESYNRTLSLVGDGVEEFNSGVKTRKTS